jgi:hypothetical protein
MRVDEQLLMSLSIEQHNTSKRLAKLSRDEVNSNREGLQSLLLSSLALATQLAGLLISEPKTPEHG